MQNLEFDSNLNSIYSCNRGPQADPTTNPQDHYCLDDCPSRSNSTTYSTYSCNSRTYWAVAQTCEFILFHYSTVCGLYISVLILLLQYDPQLSTKIVHKWMSASNPETVLLFSKHVAQCDTCGRKPEMCSMATQETYSHKHATGFIEEHLHHFTGKGEYYFI